MARRPSRVAPVWPRRFMVITAIIISILAVVGLAALFDTPSNLALAFPLFLGVVILMLFEFVLLFFHNRR